ncbi:LysM peptidoglycan-binding domain-containing protein [Streptacidiphilus sp. 4-A2]|nr:LysM peptidoglycan-binding domain-containing protein [Streptacidiphilus sp. 4-A2]
MAPRRPRRTTPPQGGSARRAPPGRTDAQQAEPVHVVRAGENLSEIAAELHLPGGWRALYAENRATVGPDPALIRPGERLRIPVSPARTRTTGSGSKGSGGKGSGSQGSGGKKTPPRARGPACLPRPR